MEVRYRYREEALTPSMDRIQLFERLDFQGWDLVCIEPGSGLAIFRKEVVPVVSVHEQGPL